MDDLCDQVHAWVAALDVPAQLLKELQATLSAEEQQRVELFRFDLHRKRFIVGRGFLRTVLSGYLDSNPSELTFDSTPNGKPRLSAVWQHSGLEFNLSHSAGMALLGVTIGAPIGVDVEHVRP